MKKVELYTDGACSGNPGPGGFGSIIIFNDKKKEISEGFIKTTNNRMELLAVINGLKLLKESCEVNVYSDSKYIVDAINKGWVLKWQKNNWMRNNKEKAINQDLWELLLMQLKIHKVTFNWVKGHSSNALNNRCDELARNAILNNNLINDEGYK